MWEVFWHTAGHGVRFAASVSAANISFVWRAEGLKWHIDILARRRSRGVCLSVWELKAPGAYGTPLHQVYIYALTLLKMLRDPELGPKWYEVFGFSGKIPASLRIEGVVAVTPDQKSALDDEFATLGTSPRLGMDTIELYAAYYDKDSLEVAFQKL